MPTAKNFDELMKMLQDEKILSKQLVGQTINCTCPACNVEVAITLLEDNKAICPNCNIKFNVNFNTKKL